MGMPFVQNPSIVCDVADLLPEMKKVATWVDDSHVFTQPQPRTRAQLAQRFLSMISATLEAPSWWLPSAEDKAAAKEKWEGIADQHATSIAPHACAHLGSIAQGGSFSASEAGALDRSKLVNGGGLGIVDTVSLHIIDPFSLAVAEASPSGAKKAQLILRPPRLDVEAMGPDGHKVNLPLRPQGSGVPWVLQHPLVHIREEYKHESVEKLIAYRRYIHCIVSGEGGNGGQEEFKSMTGTAKIGIQRILASGCFADEGNKARRAKLAKSVMNFGEVADACMLVAKANMKVGFPPLQCMGGRVRAEAVCMEFDDSLLDANWTYVHPEGYLMIKIGYQAGGWTPIWEYAHRLVLWACRGPPPIPDLDPVCMHVCHNKRCLSPWHIYWGGRNTANTNRFSLSAVHGDSRTDAPEVPDGRDLVHDHNLVFECKKEELLATLPPAKDCIQRLCNLEQVIIEARKTIALLRIQVSKEHACARLSHTLPHTHTPPACHTHTHTCLPGCLPPYLPASLTTCTMLVHIHHL